MYSSTEERGVLSTFTAKYNLAVFAKELAKDVNYFYADQLIADAGSVDQLIDLASTHGDPYVAYILHRELENLSRNNIGKLCQIIVQGKDAYLASSFGKNCISYGAIFRDDSRKLIKTARIDLTPKEIDSLFGLVMDEKTYTYDIVIFAANVLGPVQNNLKSFCYFFPCMLPDWLTPHLQTINKYLDAIFERIISKRDAGAIREYLKEGLASSDEKFDALVEVMTENCSANEAYFFAQDATRLGLRKEKLGGSMEDTIFASDIKLRSINRKQLSALQKRVVQCNQAIIAAKFAKDIPFLSPEQIHELQQVAQRNPANPDS